MRLTLAPILIACLPSLAAAQDAAAVIDRQIEAFRSGDLDLAFSFASPALRQRFGSPERFGRMVAEGYPMVRDPAEVRHLGGETVDGVRRERVLMTDRDGDTHVLEYRMREGPDGWRIHGVRILAAPGTSV